MAVPDHSEMAGSPTEQFHPDGFDATRKLIVAWADRHALVAALEFSIYPYLPLITAFARRVSVEPFNAKQLPDDELVQYEAAVVTVQYSLSASDPQTEDLVTESVEPNAEFRTLDYVDFRWGAINGDVLKEDEAPGQLLPGHDYVIKFHRLSAIPTAVVDLEGFVNASPFATYTLGRTYPAGTLLFGGGTPSRKITTAGAEEFTLTERFHFKSTGWNKFFRQSAEGPTEANPNALAVYQSIYHKTKGLHLNHPLGNFSTLLPPPPS